MRLGSIWLINFSGLMFHHWSYEMSESPPAFQSCTHSESRKKSFSHYSLEKIVFGWYLLLSQSHMSPLLPASQLSSRSMHFCLFLLILYLHNLWPHSSYKVWSKRDHILNQNPKTGDRLSYHSSAAGHQASWNLKNE